MSYQHIQEGACFVQLFSELILQQTCLQKQKQLQLMPPSQLILSTARSLGNLKISIVSEERKLLLSSRTINYSSLPILSNKKLSPASPPEDPVLKARSTAWEAMETSQSRTRFYMFQLLEECSQRELWDLTLPPCFLFWSAMFSAMAHYLTTGRKQCGQ